MLRIISYSTVLISACVVFQDIVNKLTDLMWKDWHSEVRKAAAQTLGKAGHGKDVHDDLKDRLLGGNERERQDAVAKIGHLGMYRIRPNKRTDPK